MLNQKFNACIEACNACYIACNHCAASCLQESDVKTLSKCVALDMDCAAVCSMAAGAMARGSAHAKAICAVCADICQACAEECGKHSKDHCIECAKACQQCADACMKLAAAA